MSTGLPDADPLESVATAGRECAPCASAAELAAVALRLLAADAEPAGGCLVRFRGRTASAGACGGSGIPLADEPPAEGWGTELAPGLRGGRWHDRPCLTATIAPAADFVLVRWEAPGPDLLPAAETIRRSANLREALRDALVRLTLDPPPGPLPGLPPTDGGSLGSRSGGPPPQLPPAPPDDATGSDPTGTVTRLEREFGSGSEERFRTAFMSSGIGMALVGTDGRFLKVNPALCRITGFSQPELLERNFQSITHPDDLDADLTRVHELLSGKATTFEMEKRYYRKNGTVVWAWLVVALVRDPHGKALYFISQIQDITARKKIEQELRRSEGLLRGLADNLVMGFAYQWVQEISGRQYFTYVSEGVEAVLGASAEQVISDPFRMRVMIHPDDREMVAESVRESRSRLTPFDHICRYVTDTGALRWLHFRATPQRLDAGTTSWDGIAFDVTSQKLVEQELRRAKDEADAANHAKSRFVANVSHELRTPLNGILGMAQLLIVDGLDPLQAERAGLIAESGRVLLSIINDLLDYSKLEAGRFTVSPEPMDLIEVVDVTVRSLAVRAAEQQLEMPLICGGTIPAVVSGDPVRLRQILVNLLGNALKFTQHGSVTLSMNTVGSPTPSERPDGLPTVRIRFEVADTGIGIPRDQFPRIFEAFTQGDPGRIMQTGTGLGLTIAARLVEMMGGKLDLDSTPGLGSTFGFELPFPVIEPRCWHEPRLSGRGRSCLIVEPQPRRRTALAETFLACGWDVLACTTAVEAAERLVAERNDRPAPALALLSVEAGRGGGGGLADELPRLIGGPLPILRLQPPAGKARPYGSPRPDPHDPAWPYPPGELRRKVDAVLRNAAAVPAAEPRTEPPAMRPLRVLLAEDNLVNQKVLVQVLHRDGHLVTLARNGREALDRYREGAFDVILMDVQMPELDGLAATRAIRTLERETGSRVPILAMTARAMPSDRDACLESGMDGYLTKPLDLEEFQQALERLTERLAPVAEPAVPAPPRPADPAQPGDLRSLVELVGHDPHALREIAMAYQADSTRIMAALRRGVAACEAPPLAAAAHELAGLGLNFGGGPLVALARRLEQAARSGERGHWAPLVEQLTVPVEALGRRLQNLADSFDGPGSATD